MALAWARTLFQCYYTGISTVCLTQCAHTFALLTEGSCFKYTSSISR